MNFEFKKFLIKKSSIWSTGNFKIFDSDSRLVYKVKSPVWQFKKKMRFLSLENGVEYYIEQTSSWPQKFSISENDILIASFEKANIFKGKHIDVISSLIEDFSIKANMWGSNFNFYHADEEIAMLSYNMWSFKEFGLAVKGEYPVDIIVATAVTIAFMKESGQM